MHLMRKFEVYKKGRRYWCGLAEYHPFLNKTKYIFYSNHKFPFYKGSYTQDGFNKEEAYQKFLEWIPD